MTGNEIAWREKMSANKQEVLIEQVNDGYVITMRGFIHSNGRYVKKSDEIFELLEFLGENMAQTRIKVERR